MIIAVDGPAAAGKGTLSRNIAEAFDFAHLDTGSIYRATAKKVLDNGIDPEDDAACAEVARNLTADDLTSDGLRDRGCGPSGVQGFRHSGRPRGIVGFPTGLRQHSATWQIRGGFGRS